MSLMNKITLILKMDAHLRTYRFIRLFNNVELSYFKLKEALVITHFISKVQLITTPFILAKC